MKKMQKSSFIHGALIATICIIITKILGLLYVIPFHKIIGKQGGALYGYAYSLYDVFLTLSTVGIPLAMSKLISQYSSLGYFNTKDRVYKLTFRIILITSILATVVLLIFTPSLAKIIIGNLEGGNSHEDIIYVVRVLASSLVIVSVLSIYRARLQGQKFIQLPSYSQVIEQIVRIAIILIGSYISAVVLKLSIKVTVSIAVFAVTIGSLIAFIYLYFNVKDKDELKPVKYIMSKEEKAITDKEILKKIIHYSLPFIITGFATSLIRVIDTITIVRILTEKAHFIIEDAENISSIFNTWGSKLVVIVTTVSDGVVVSLLPHITSSFAKGDMDDVAKKINQSLQLVIVCTIPMAVGMMLLSKEIWYVFYGLDSLGPNVFKVYILYSIFFSLAITSISIMQSLNQFKILLASLSVGIITKFFGNYLLIPFFSSINIPGYHGASISTMLAFGIIFTINMINIIIKFKYKYKDTLIILLKTLFNVSVMSIILMLINTLLNIRELNLLNSIFIIIINGVIGASVYLVLSYKMKILHEVFGNNNIDKIRNKIIKKKYSQYKLNEITDKEYLKLNINNAFPLYENKYIEINKRINKLNTVYYALYKGNEIIETICIYYINNDHYLPLFCKDITILKPLLYHIEKVFNNKKLVLEPFVINKDKQDILEELNLLNRISVKSEYDDANLYCFDKESFSDKKFIKNVKIAIEKGVIIEKKSNDLNNSISNLYEVAIDFNKYYTSCKNKLTKNKNIKLKGELQNNVNAAKELKEKYGKKHIVGEVITTKDISNIIIVKTCDISEFKDFNIKYAIYQFIFNENSGIINIVSYDRNNDIKTSIANNYYSLGKFIVKKGYVNDSK